MSQLINNNWRTVAIVGWKQILDELAKVNSKIFIEAIEWFIKLFGRERYVLARGKHWFCLKSVNAKITISISSNTKFCNKMAKEKKCYEDVAGSYELNYACIDQNLPPGIPENFRISTQCSTTTSLVCVQNATSKISIKQCYHSVLDTGKTYVWGFYNSSSIKIV